MIVGLVGKKRSGKNTAADFICETVSGYGLSVRQFAFADEVKKICGSLYGLSERQLYGDLKEVPDQKWGLSARQILQKFGTEVARQVHPETWIRVVMDRDIPAHKADVSVITDVRFPNEADFIRSRGGVLVRIERPQAVFSDSHSSETEMDSISTEYHLTNDSGLHQLERHCEELAKEFVFMVKQR